MLIIGITCYNSEQYISKSIYSVQLQKEQNWKCFITNDLSSDNSLEVMKQQIGDDKRFVIINNTEKYYQARNYYQICHHEDVNEDDMFIELDGDDCFSDDEVLTRVNKYYEDPNVWLTFGSFKYSDGRMGFAQSPVGGINQQRISHSFVTSHLRTWRIGLFRHLEKKDLMEDNEIDWIPVSCDLFFFQCMLELCGDGHYLFTKDINYVYHPNNLSEHIVSMPKVTHYTNMAKTREPKKALESL